MQQVVLQVDDEYVAFGQALKNLIGDIKAKKSVMQDITDFASPLIGSLGSIANAGADIKKVDNEVYLLKCIAEAAEAPAPAVVAAPAQA